MRFSNARLAEIAIGALLILMPRITMAGQIQALPDPSSFERILLPVSIFTQQVEAVGGAHWATVLSYRNDADVPVPIFQAYGVYFCTAVQIECSVGPPVAPHSSGVDSGVPPTESSGPVGIGNNEDDNLGTFLYVDRGSASLVHLNMVLQQIGSSDLGTEVPAISEDEMKVGTVELMNVPLSASVRTALRVYSPRPADASLASFRVQIFEGDAETPTVDDTIQTERTLTPLPDAFPDYLVVPNVGLAYPQLSSTSTLRIEVTPVDAQTSYWAFASVIDNVSQHVMLVTPQ